jgi:hypothetical protein
MRRAQSYFCLLSRDSCSLLFDRDEAVISAVGIEGYIMSSMVHGMRKNPR